MHGTRSTAKGIRTLGAKPPFVKGGYTKGVSAAGTSLAAGSKDGGVSLDSAASGAAGADPFSTASRDEDGFPVQHAVNKSSAHGTAHTKTQRGAARGRASNDPMGR
jgi:hypothetical protein